MKARLQWPRLVFSIDARKRRLTDWQPFFFSASSMIYGTIDLTVSHYLVRFAWNVLFSSVMVYWAWGRMTVFFFVGQGTRLEIIGEVEQGACCKVPSWHFLSRTSRLACLVFALARRAISQKGRSFNTKCLPDTRVDGASHGKRGITNGLACARMTLTFFSISSSPWFCSAWSISSNLLRQANEDFSTPQPSGLVYLCSCRQNTY